MKAYKGAMDEAEKALTDAQGEIKAYKKEADDYRAKGGKDEATLTAEAQKILDKLAGKYRGVVGKLTPMQRLAGESLGGSGDPNGSGGPNDKSGDSKDGGTKNGDTKDGSPSTDAPSSNKPGGPPPATSHGGPPNTPFTANDTMQPPPISSFLTFPFGNLAGPPTSVKPPFAFLTKSNSLGTEVPPGSSVPPVRPGPPRFGDSVNTVIGRPGQPGQRTVLTSLGRPPTVEPGEVPKVPTVDIPSSGSPRGPVPSPFFGNTALTGSARDSSGTGRRTQSGAPAEEGEETVSVRQGVPMPMMPMTGVGGTGDRGSQRRTSLQGDEDWESKGGVDGALGRPTSLAPRAEG
jgi:hypothetical protein